MEEIAALIKNHLPEGSELGFDMEDMCTQKREQMKADIYNAEVGDLDKEDGYNCDICKNKGFVAYVAQSDFTGFYSETLRSCKCSRIRNAIRRLNRSGLKDAVKKYTFDRYEAADRWQQMVKDAALRFCEHGGQSWYFIGGQSGAGKTHICTAIAVAKLKQGAEVRYMVWREEVPKIKASITDPMQYASMMDELKKADVLYIDDLFKSGKGDDGTYKPPTAADVNLAFEIINYRYNNPALVTIISSERTLVELNDIDEAIAGRIAEKSKEGGYCFNLKPDASKNWRMKGMIEM